MDRRLKTFEVDSSVRKELHQKVRKLPQVTSFSCDFSFSSLLASYGILREIGSPNDEIARFLFDSKTKIRPSP